MVTKHFLLSLWNVLEGVKGTPRITRKTSSSFPSRKGTGQMKEVGDNRLRYVKPCFGSSSLALFSREASAGTGGG